MKCWKNGFDEKTLENAVKFKDEITDISNDGCTFKACAKGRYHVELIIQDDILYDMSCTCSKKSGCAHEAALLYFLEEFPEILEDFKTKTADIEKISKANVDKDLKVISKDKLVKFIKKEFKKNPKTKYDFMKHFSEESLIDGKAYARKLKGILRKGKERGFSNHGYYSLEKIAGDLKRFMKKDIQILIDLKEYPLAYELLNEIMDIFIDPIYRRADAWYDIAYYYRQYCYILIEEGVLSPEEEEHIQGHFSHINYILF